MNDAGAKGAITIDPFVQQATLTAADGAAGDHLGTAVAISGSTVVVGAPAHGQRQLFPGGGLRIRGAGAGLAG